MWYNLLFTGVICATMSWNQDGNWKWESHVCLEESAGVNQNTSGAKCSNHGWNEIVGLWDCSLQSGFIRENSRQAELTLQSSTIFFFPSWQAILVKLNFNRVELKLWSCVDHLCQPLKYSLRQSLNRLHMEEAFMGVISCVWSTWLVGMSWGEKLLKRSSFQLFRGVSLWYLCRLAAFPASEI